MGIHEWRKRQTRYFGETWVSYAQIDIARSDGKYQSFALQVDSGAVISLLRRSVAELLGIELEKGERVELGNVGGGQTEAYVHSLPTRFADTINLAVPYAIATEEGVPNLLGRNGVFDNLQMDFDATLAETRITAPWLDARGRIIWEKFIHAEKQILKNLATSEFSDSVKQAASMLLRRGYQLVAAAAGLIKLHRAFAGPLFIRHSFESAAQFEYLMKDPDRRSIKYLDFALVTRHVRSQEIAKNPTGPISSYVAKSPLRTEGEKRNQVDFDRVRAQFLSKRGRLSPNWYCKSIRELTKEIGWEGEYRFWYALGSAWAHSDPFYAQRPTIYGKTDGQATMVMCLHYYARMLLRVSSGMILTAEQHELLTKLAEEIC